MHPTLGLGILVRARVDYKWDDYKAQYIGHLMSTVTDAAAKTQLEAVRFANDGIAVYHRLIGPKFRDFLRTGKAEDLGEFKDMSFKTYQSFIALMLQLTGQSDKTKVDTKLGGEITHKHEMVSNEKTIDVDVTGKGLLDFLEKTGVGK